MSDQDEPREPKLLEVNFATHPAYDPAELEAELLSDEEYEAIIEREQQEADAWAAAHPKA